MSTHCWRITGQDAHLELGPLSARLAMHRPHDGIREVRLAGHAWAPSRLLAAALPETAAAVDDLAITDHYLRDQDFVVTYAPTRPSELTCQLYWSGRQWGDAVGVRWVLSISTQHLHVRPLVQLTNEIAAASDEGPAVGYFVPSEATLTSLDRPAITVVRRPGAAETDGQRTLASAATWIARPAGSAWSSLHFIYPTDVVRYAATPLQPGGRVAADLLDERMEKGVIRRLQAEVWWVPRASDVNLARDLFAEFLASDPPLTT